MREIYISIVIIFIISAIIYLYYEDNVLQISHYKIVNSKIPDEFKNYKIIQISDFHNVKSKKLNKDLVENISKEKPDIIVITGDFVDANRTNIDVAINFINNIKDIAKVYYVTGNHEWAAKEYNQLKKELIKLGVKILDNKLEKITINDSSINLIGINDPSFANEPTVEDKEIVNKEINDIDYDDENFTILLSHRPELYDVYVNNSIDLALTGHAHGGQIRLPIIKGILAPNQGLFPKYSEGIFTKENTTMVVSRGIGNSVFPFRINNRPELVVIELFGTG